MRTRIKILKDLEQKIPTELMAEYDNLTFGEMAEVKELEAWKEDLAKAEHEWSAIEELDY